MTKPVAVRISYTMPLSKTTWAFLNTETGKRNADVYLQNLQEQGERFALDMTQQWINEGSCIPTFEIIYEDDIPDNSSGR